MTEWRLVRGAYPPAMHMALDEVITEKVSTGERPPTLRIWDWQTPAAVIGRFQAVRDEVFTDLAETYGVEVVRRSTGGGAMFCEPGTVITYSLSLPESMVDSDSIVESYRELEAWSISGLNEIGVDAAHKPVNDIVHGEQKIGGSAQGRKHGAVLHHTMLAYDLDIEKMLKVLKIGTEKISDKAIASAEKRVSPIRTQVDLAREDVIEALLNSFAQGRSLAEEDVTQEERKEAEELVTEKYGAEDWLYSVDREIEGFME